MLLSFWKDQIKSFGASREMFGKIPKHLLVQVQNNWGGRGAPPAQLRPW